MRPREFIAWALVSLALVLNLFNARRVDSLEEIAAFERERAQTCEDHLRATVTECDEMKEVLDRCAEVVTKMAPCQR